MHSIFLYIADIITHEEYLTRSMVSDWCISSQKSQSRS